MVRSLEPAHFILTEWKTRYDLTTPEILNIISILFYLAESMKKKIALLITRLAQQQPLGKENSQDSSTKDLPKLLDGKSKEILHASAALEIRY